MEKILTGKVSLRQHGQNFFTPPWPPTAAEFFGINKHWGNQVTWRGCLRCTWSQVRRLKCTYFFQGTLHASELNALGESKRGGHRSFFAFARAASWVHQLFSQVLMHENMKKFKISILLLMKQQLFPGFLYWLRHGFVYTNWNRMNIAKT